MGAYLSHPITEKLSSDENNDKLKCGASSMQGWRVAQEDAHNCILDFADGSSLFAVYDGHGGKEVAEYTAMKLPDVIKNNESFKKGDYNLALKESFLSFDKGLTNPEVIAVLKTIAKSPGSDVTTKDDEDLDESLGHLQEEAAMPLDQLMARYRKEKVGEPKDAPASPFLRAKASSEASSSGVSSSSKPEDEAEVSSSSSGGPSSSEKRETPRKSLEEKYSNGDCEKVEGSEEVVQNGEGDDAKDEVSSSVENPPVEGKGKALIKGSPVKKKDVVSAEDLFKKFVASGAADDDSSDSDENFPVASSDDDDDAEGEAADGESDEDADEEEEEEEEEEDDDENEDDDNLFSMKMTDELVAAIREGRPLPVSAPGESEEEELDEEEARISSRFLIDALTKKRPAFDSGCTAVVALVCPSRVIVANAGDSRCIACRAGKAVDLSFDHKPEDAKELSRITKAGGKVTNDGRVNGGLNLSRALGDHVYKQVTELSAEEQMISPVPDLQEIELTDDIEFMVLACDGIWNFMSSQEVVDFVRPRLRKNPKNLSAICEELFDHCLAPHTCGDGTGCDNMTAIIVQFRPIPEDPALEKADQNEVADACKEIQEPESSSQQEEDKPETAKRRADAEAEAAPKKCKTDSVF